jgi:hypothetical protein
MQTRWLLSADLAQHANHSTDNLVMLLTKGKSTCVFTCHNLYLSLQHLTCDATCDAEHLSIMHSGSIG